MNEVIESKFVIKHDTWGTNNYYVNHGPFAGAEETVSYSKKEHAKQFDTEAEAQNHIDHVLPNWTKQEKYVVEEISEFDRLFFTKQRDDEINIVRTR